MIGMDIGFLTSMTGLAAWAFLIAGVAVMMIAADAVRGCRGRVGPS